MTNIRPEDMDRHVIKEMSDEAKSDLNADPITGAAGSHPVGTGIGATIGGVVGTVLGAVGGPVGIAAGIAVGSAVGGMVGHSGGELLDPTEEDAYWREAYLKRPYYEANYDYDRDYLPAYRLGYLSRSEYKQAEQFDLHEAELRNHWESRKGDSQLNWEQAKLATRDAWDRPNY